MEQNKFENGITINIVLNYIFGMISKLKKYYFWSDEEIIKFDKYGIVYLLFLIKILQL